MIAKGSGNQETGRGVIFLVNKRIKEGRSGCIFTILNKRKNSTFIQLTNF